METISDFQHHARLIHGIEEIVALSCYRCSPWGWQGRIKGPPAAPRTHINAAM